jgi:hypothetical protein
MMNSIYNQKERDQERETHIFNVVKQFAYVHREAAIILLKFRVTSITYIYIYIYIYREREREREEKTLNPTCTDAV